MSAIVKGVGDLIGSVMEIFQGIISTIVGMFSSVLHLFTDLIKNIFGAAEGLIGFILGEFLRSNKGTGCIETMLTCPLLGNIVIIGAIAGAFGIYVIYQQRQGKPVTVGNKKIN
jgi:phage-related protein